LLLFLSVGCTTNNNQPQKSNEVVNSDKFKTIDLFKATDEPKNTELQIDTMRKYFNFCDITYRIAAILDLAKIEYECALVRFFD
jgi:hypothetical protein